MRPSLLLLEELLLAQRRRTPLTLSSKAVNRRHGTFYMLPCQGSPFVCGFLDGQRTGPRRSAGTPAIFAFVRVFIRSHSARLHHLRRYKTLFSSMDLTRDFYFSHAYDLTNTLQVNISGALVSDSSLPYSSIDPANAPGHGSSATVSVSCPRPRPQDKFIWNHHLALGLFRRLSTSRWAPPLAHGFFLQQSMSLFG